MSYELAVKELSNMLNMVNASYSIEHLVGDGGVYVNIFNPDHIMNIKTSGYIGNFTIKWPVERFFLYGLSDLIQKQEGYRTENGAADPNWDQEKYVIGDWAADPVSIDKSGSIWYSAHGEGTWSYRKISSSLEEFFISLSKWISYFLIQNNGKIRDEKRRIIPEKKIEIFSIVLGHLDDECKDGFTKFLFS
jgi:hypothetical protein